jgi:alpha-N-arabinofuranosidase
MRAVDDSIETVICGSSNYGMRTFGEWEATTLDIAYDAVNYVSLHQYFDNRNDDTASFLAKNMDMERFIKSVVSICDYIKGKKHSNHTVNLSFDEWNVWYHSNGEPFEKWSKAPHQLEDIYNYEDALLVGLILITLLRNCDRVKVACLAQLVNVIAPIMTENGGRMFEQTIYYPFSHVSNFGRGSVLHQVIDSPMHDTKEFSSVPDIDSVSVLSDDENELTVFAVNRNDSEDVLYEVRLVEMGDFKPVEFIQMSGFDLKQSNGFDSSPVKPSKAALPDMEGDKAKIKLPPLSWNVIRFKK